MKFIDLIGNAERPALEDWCRKNTQQAYVGGHTALARVLGSILMYVDTRDLSVTPHLLMNGFWEMWVTQAVCNYVKPGMVAIDIGANAGYYTALLSELVGDKGFVQAYEPQVRLVELLKKTISVNGYVRWAQVSGAAVSDRAGPATLFSHPSWLGSAALLPGGHPGEDPFAVSTIALDGEGFTGARCRDVHFVKIDVQGHEMQVLAGMQNIISRNRRIAIAMEFTPSEHEDPRAALEVIQSYGLDICAVGTDGLVRPISLEQGAAPDTGDHRMLWLQKWS